MSKLLLNQQDRKRFPKYLLGGVLSTGLDIFIFNFFTTVFKINFLISNSISFICAVLISFFFNKYITFEYSDNNSTVKHISIFFIISIVSLGISNSLIFLFITYFSLIPLYAKFIQICISYPINYFMIKKFVFRFE